MCVLRGEGADVGMYVQEGGGKGRVRCVGR